MTTSHKSLGVGYKWPGIKLQTLRKLPRNNLGHFGNISVIQRRVAFTKFNHDVNSTRLPSRNHFLCMNGVEVLERATQPLETPTARWERTLLPLPLLAAGSLASEEETRTSKIRMPREWNIPLFSTLSKRIRRFALAVLRRDLDAHIQQSSVAPRPRLRKCVDSLGHSLTRLDR